MLFKRKISREDVIWCFTHILGRSQLTDSQINHFIVTEKNLKSLIITLLSSNEYRSRFNHLPIECKQFKDGFNYDDTFLTQERILRILQKIKPYAVRGINKIRVGNSNDGGYVMLNNFDNISAAYSLGISNDVSWDLDIAKRGIDVYQYDHTIEDTPIQHNKFHFFKIGIAEVKKNNFQTLSNLIRDNGHSENRNLILKCDIEGDEWKMLANIEGGILNKFSQIVIETHGWQLITGKNIGSDQDFSALVEEAINKLTLDHKLIHVHANNHTAYSIVGSIPVPAVLELTFAREDDELIFEESSETFPTSLDAPCSPLRADFYLGNFRF